MRRDPAKGAGEPGQGPGTRFVVLLAGCPLRCRFCHSPDTWYRRSGRHRTVDELMARAERYRRLIPVAGGGVTISGGEPLLQPRFTGEVLRCCHALGLHTALDTSGFLGARADDALLDATDLVLLDVKSRNPATYRRVTRTGEIGPTLRLGRRLAARGTPIWVRFVLVPGLQRVKVFAVPRRGRIAAMRESRGSRQLLGRLTRTRATGAAATGAQATGARATGARAVGAMAVGAMAVGAMAVGVVAIGRLVIRRAVIRELRIGRLEVDELIVHRRLGGDGTRGSTDGG
ncbi:radical SAM protein [Micromonospora sp. KC207]|nr:radical SAM protein [Micromonospora sp. KC207]